MKPCYRLVSMLDLIPSTVDCSCDKLCRVSSDIVQHGPCGPGKLDRYNHNVALRINVLIHMHCYTSNRQ